MFFPNIFGAYDTRDLPSLRVGVDVPEADVMRDIQAWRDYYNRVVTLYEDMLCTREQKATGQFGTGGGGGEMQPYTEYGETEATRTAEANWGWGAPIRRYRDRVIYTEEYLATKSLEQINKDTIYATNRNYTTRLKMILRAIVRNTNYLWVDGTFPGSDAGQFTVFALFNADGTAASLNVNGEIVAMGTEQSYLPSGAASIAINNFNVGRAKLRARGETGRVIHIVSQTDADTVRGLAGFIPPPQTGTQYVQVTGPIPTTTTAIITRPESIGSISNAGTGDGELIAFPFWPAGYTFSFDATKDKPVVIREHADAQFRGWRLVQDQTLAAYGADAIRNKRWEYIAGTAIRNRANGVVVKATAGAYSVPTI
jgi:hypothetical protein